MYNLKAYKKLITQFILDSIHINQKRALLKLPA